MYIKSYETGNNKTTEMHFFRYHTPIYSTAVVSYPVTAHLFQSEGGIGNWSGARPITALSCIPAPLALLTDILTGCVPPERWSTATPAATKVS